MEITIGGNDHDEANFSVEVLKFESGILFWNESLGLEPEL